MRARCSGDAAPLRMDHVCGLSQMRPSGSALDAEQDAIVGDAACEPVAMPEVLVGRLIDLGGRPCRYLTAVSGRPC